MPSDALVAPTSSASVLGTRAADRRRPGRVDHEGDRLVASWLPAPSTDENATVWPPAPDTVIGAPVQRDRVAAVDRVGGRRDARAAGVGRAQRDRGRAGRDLPAAGTGVTDAVVTGAVESSWNVSDPAGSWLPAVSTE